MKKLATALVISSIIIATNAFASPNQSSSSALSRLAADSRYYSANQNGNQDWGRGHFRYGHGDNDHGRGYYDHDHGHHDHGWGRGCFGGDAWHSHDCRHPVSP